MKKKRIIRICSKIRDLTIKYKINTIFKVVLSIVFIRLIFDNLDTKETINIINNLDLFYVLIKISLYYLSELFLY